MVLGLNTMGKIYKVLHFMYQTEVHSIKMHQMYVIIILVRLVLCLSQKRKYIPANRADVDFSPLFVQLSVIKQNKFVRPSSANPSCKTIQE